MSYAGFDTSQFPGLPMMAALKRDFSFCGFYLPAPSHSNSSWTGNRQALVDQGWGVVPIYVGQQITGPGSHAVTAAQGTIDGQSCAARMDAEGFPKGSTVYLDLENGAPYQPPQTEYVLAWANALGAGGFNPGIYCSHGMADDVATSVRFARIWAFKVPTVDRTEATAPFPSDDPSGSGYPQATLWQARQNVHITGPGYDLVVDLDTSNMADPSEPVVPKPVPEPVPGNTTTFTVPPVANPGNTIVYTVTYGGGGAGGYFPPKAPPSPSQPSVAAKTVQAVSRRGPPIAAGATATTVLGAAAAAGVNVDVHRLVDALWPYLLTGIVLPLAVWLVGRALTYLHIQTQSALADEIRTVVENGVSFASSAAQAAVDQHATVTVPDARVAAVVNYVQTAIPSKLAASGVTPTQLQNLVVAKLNQVPQ